MAGATGRNADGPCRRAASVLALLFVAPFAGCAVGPDFHASRPAVPATWHATGEAPSRPVPAPVDPTWWHAFGDPELDALENRVADANLDVQVATIRLAESREQRHIATAAEFPRVDGNGSYGRTRLSPRGQFGLISGGGGGDTGTGASAGGAASSAGLPSTIGGIGNAIREPFNLFQYGFDASWELDLWGRVRRSIESADAQVDASAEDRRNVLIGMLAEVARDYLQLRNVQALLAIARSNQEADRQTLILSRQRYQGGLTSEVDVDNATAQLSEVVASLPQLEQQQSQQINRLSFLLGAEPGALATELLRPSPMRPLPVRVPVGLPSELARRRPDIREAEARLHAATAQVGVAEAGFYPQVTLSGNLSLQALRFTSLGNWDSRTYTFGPNLTLPIFEGGKLKAQLKLNRAQEVEAAATYRRTVLNAFHEVDDAMVAYDAEQRRSAQLRDNVATNQRTLDLATTRYRRGLGDFLTVLAAERGLLGAQQSLQNSQATVDLDVVSLYLALGGGWEARYPVPADATPPPPAPGPAPVAAR